MDVKAGLRGWALLLGIAAILLVGAMIITSTVRPLSPLENMLFELLILSTSVSASYLFGRQSARHAAQEMIKPAARSAFRRVLGLYSSLSRMAKRLQDIREGSGSQVHQLEIVEVFVGEQLASVTDAMEDWRDLVPEDVKEVERRLEARAEVEEFTDDQV